jgi:hypothetical protein
MLGIAAGAYFLCGSALSARELIAETAIEALMRNFPDETRQAIKKLF